MLLDGLKGDTYPLTRQLLSRNRVQWCVDTGHLSNFDTVETPMGSSVDHRVQFYDSDDLLALTVAPDI